MNHVFSRFDNSRLMTHIFTGWTGDTCEENVDECENSPCENGGMCMDMPGNFLCGCPMGRCFMIIPPYNLIENDVVFLINAIYIT